jgi:cysteine/O-acetylserine efflux protein
VTADTVALATFIVVTSFTPGPNNISSASMGILHGYRTSLPYLFGITAGFLVVMVLCGVVSSTLIGFFPPVERALRYVGAAYILWLAYHTLRASYTFEEDRRTVFGFARGVFLQVLNPKVIVYGFTLYSTFLSGVVKNAPSLAGSALALAGVAFCATSSWALFGAVIRAHLNRPRVKRILNLALALLLVYTAVQISGVLELIFPK